MSTREKIPAITAAHIRHHRNCVERNCSMCDEIETVLTGLKDKRYFLRGQTPRDRFLAKALQMVMVACFVAIIAEVARVIICAVRA